MHPKIPRGFTSETTLTLLQRYTNFSILTKNEAGTSTADIVAVSFGSQLPVAHVLLYRWISQLLLISLHHQRSECLIHFTKGGIWRNLYSQVVRQESRCFLYKHGEEGGQKKNSPFKTGLKDYNYLINKSILLIKHMAKMLYTAYYQPVTPVF